jgi:predicted Zn-dependent peptidase
MTPQHAILPNGLEVIAQPMPHAKSVALALVVRSGSRADTLGGTAHFLEHMMFKSGKHSALGLSQAFDSIGAYANAFTSHELTTYTSFALPKTQSQQTELLLGMMQPKLEPSEIALEREVILEEIELYRDDPMNIALEQSASAYFGQHPLGQPVIGTRESVRQISQASLKQHLDSHYTSANMVLAVCGKYDWERLLEDARHYSSQFPVGQRHPSPALAVKPKHGILPIQHDSAHVQVSFVANGFAANHSLELPAAVLSRILGDSENSRLSWALVHSGLALSVSLEHEGHSDVGAFYGALECDPENTQACLDLLAQTIKNTKQHGITQHELTRIKRKLEVGLALRLETPNAWLGAFAEDYVLQGDLRSPLEVLQQIRAIRLEEVNQALAASGLEQPMVVALGETRHSDYFWATN